MATFLLVVLGLYALWILAVLAHANSLVVISSENWLYRIHQYWYSWNGEKPASVMGYGRNLIFLPFWIVALYVVSIILGIMIGCAEFFFWLFPSQEKEARMKPLIVFDPPSS